MQRSLRADLVLLFVTMLWGATFPAIRDAVFAIDPYWFVALRMALAAIIMLPIVFTQLYKTDTKLLFHGAVLGVLNAGVYLFQTLGLTSLPSGLSAFITGTSVVIVPFLLPLFRLGWPRKIDLLGSFLCLMGLYVLTGANLTHFTLAEALTLGCAFFYASYVVYLQKVSQQTEEILLLAFYQIVFCLPIPLFSALAMHRPLHVDAEALYAIVFCALGATCLAIYLQTRFQKQTTAPRAAIIFVFEPVFGAFFGWLINNEAITHGIFIGGILIICSILMVELGPKMLRKYSNKGC